tara:strand:- start:1739 stop:2620 length:882 start_codon:yes stop_codon:yes gene_type:complete
MSELERVLNAREKKIKNSFFSKINNKLKNFLRIIFPKFYEFKDFKKKKQTFSGWGLSTDFTCSPWKNLNENNNLIFNKINKDLIEKVENKKFNLTQFEYKDTDYKKILEELSWRHYVVFNSVLYISNFTENDQINIVECGVCDGLTMNFAMSLCLEKKINFKSYLYDAWADLSVIKNENLRFKYSYLDIETTKKNLNKFSNYSIYNKGFIPEVFEKSENPEKVSWLHIDLNSSEATISALEFFYGRIVNNGIILFDDYGGFEKTRIKIDNFFSDKKGHFINFPTGQGIFYKKN